MPNPFPGMNPYLESPDFWPEVHHLLIGILQESLVPQLVPKYRVAIEKRIYEIKEEQSLLVGFLTFLSSTTLLPEIQVHLM